MYCRHFGLSEDPFQLTPDPQFLFLDEIYREAMAHLEYGVQTGRGFVLLTGEVGTGKTTLVHSFLDKYYEDFNSAFIFSSAMNFIEMLKLIHEDLGTGVKNDSEAFLLIELNRYLLQEHRDGKKTVLILDEGQNLPVELLEKIRMLSNLEARKSKLIQIILVGQPELAEKLERSDLRQLRQRVAVRFHLPPMSEERTIRYIEHRLSVADGANREFFTHEALHAIHVAAGGIPRLVNVICSNTLLLAFGADARRIDENLVKEVVNDLRRGVPERRPSDERTEYEKIADEAIGVRATGSDPLPAPPHGAGPAPRYDDNRPLTTEEAGAYLRVSTKTIRSLFQKGLIRASKVGRGWRTLKSDLDGYIRFGPAPSGPPQGEGELVSAPQRQDVEQECDGEVEEASEQLGGAIGEMWASAREAYKQEREIGKQDESTGNGGSGVYRQPDRQRTASGGVRSGNSG